MHLPAFTLRLPEWMSDVLPPPGTTFPTPLDRMRLAIELARRNVTLNTGGPFGAAVFDLESARLVAPGVNLVIASGTSVAHAEMVALILAQQRAGDYDLGGGGRRFELVTSTEPCAMCYGAIPWSGVRRLVCGARREDAEKVGFDEGDKPADWAAALERRGIEVLRDVLRSEAAAVLARYARGGGAIYNPQ